VARPHGILTRFPILPNLLGHPDAFNYKERFVIDADTITLGFTVSIPATRHVICWDSGRLAANVLKAPGLSEVIRNSFSRFAHIAAGTPAVPAIT
jgi:hypothetical protein